MFTRAMLCCSAFLLSAATALAVPNTMNYQGQLFLNGSPTAGSVSIIFRMYDAQTGGTELWTETDLVTATQGLFNTTLGDGTAFPATLFSAQVPWLEMEVNGTVMTPRTEFASVPYALNVPSTGGSELWETDGMHVWRLTGSVGVGTPDPLSIAWFGDPAHVVSGARPTVSLNTTQTSGLATIQFSGPTAGSQFHVNYVDAAQPFVDFGTNFRIYNSGNDGTKFTIAQNGDLLAASGNLSLANGRVGFGNGGTDVVLGVRTAGPARAMVDGNGTLFLNYLNDFPNGVHINGSLTVDGTKCRAVMTPYGQLKMNAVESAHALFIDDEPSARLVDGRCRVNLSPKFLATVTVNGKYPLAINVTFYGRHGGEWYVERDATGFTVIDPSGSNAELSWQAIARQRGYEDHDLEPVEVQTARK